MASKIEQDPARARAGWFGRWAIGGMLTLGCASSTAPAPSEAAAQDGGAHVGPPPAALPDGGAKRAPDAVQAEASKQGACPPEMVYVPGGTFMMGDKDDRNAPLHKVTLTKPYCIDRLEVTLEDYQRCEKARACTKSGAPKRGAYGGGPNCTEKREGRGKHPINCITWRQAHAYCKWAKKRLPTEAEWEFAARGPKSFRWPWGDQPPTPQLAWSSMYKAGVYGTTEVGRYPAGASPFGALDMGGNVGEWVQDWDVKMGANKEDAVDPAGPAAGYRRVIKDISWDGALPSYNMGDRGAGDPDENVYDTVGVRCALTAP